MPSLREALAAAGIARAIAAEVPVGHQQPSPSEGPLEQLLASLIEDTELADVTVKLFTDGHYALAVEQAYKCVDTRVSAKARASASGQELMFLVFSSDKPQLRLNSMRSVTDKDEQDGFKFIFGGCMRAIRNPRAHDHLFVDEREDAFVMILWADYLLRRVEAARPVRKRKAK